MPSGLFVLTARRGAAETGVLVSWVQQCSFRPPLLTLCIGKERFVLEWLTEGAAFTLNILDESQTDMIAHFGKGFGPGEDAFAGLEVERSETAAPVLQEVLGYLHCRVVGSITPGDHAVLIAEVIGGRVVGEGHPMIHVRKSGAHY